MSTAVRPEHGDAFLIAHMVDVAAPDDPTPAVNDWKAWADHVDKTTARQNATPPRPGRHRACTCPGFCPRHTPTAITREFT